MEESIQELDTLYKLMILFMLNRAGQSVTRAKIYEFMLGRYTDYLHVNVILNELIENGFIRSETKRNKSNIEITDDGREILNMFPERLSSGIKKEITDFLIEKEYEIKNEMSIRSGYDRTTAGDYLAEMTIRENNSELLTVRISLPAEGPAKTVCDNWDKNCQDIYKWLMQKLLEE
ncbi:MAG: DUF4364 family protein [Lachnospiraceae bacterium]|nr:DUF4364 family protein [Lachnospiraceae bacterium]